VALRVLVVNNLAWDAEARVIARMSLVKVRFCCGKAALLTLRGQRRGRALSLRPAWAAGERFLRALWRGGVFNARALSQRRDGVRGMEVMSVQATRDGKTGEQLGSVSSARSGGRTGACVAELT
jgi:hypothetical protein